MEFTLQKPYAVIGGETADMSKYEEALLEQFTKHVHTLLQQNITHFVFYSTAGKPEYLSTCMQQFITYLRTQKQVTITIILRRIFEQPQVYDGLTVLHLQKSTFAYIEQVLQKLMQEAVCLLCTCSLDGFKTSKLVRIATENKKEIHNLFFETNQKADNQQQLYQETIEVIKNLLADDRTDLQTRQNIAIMQINKFMQK